MHSCAGQTQDQSNSICWNEHVTNSLIRTQATGRIPDKNYTAEKETWYAGKWCWSEVLNVETADRV